MNRIPMLLSVLFCGNSSRRSRWRLTTEAVQRVLVVYANMHVQFTWSKGGEARKYNVLLASVWNCLAATGKLRNEICARTQSFRLKLPIDHYSVV